MSTDIIIFEILYTEDQREIHFGKFEVYESVEEKVVDLLAARGYYTTGTSKGIFVETDSLTDANAAAQIIKANNQEVRYHVEISVPGSHFFPVLFEMGRDDVLMISKFRMVDSREFASLNKGFISQTFELVYYDLEEAKAVINAIANTTYAQRI